MPIMISKKKKYYCYCGHSFTAYAVYFRGETSVIDGKKGKKSSGSGQIVCPNCLWTIPTWERIDGVKVRK